MQCDICNKELVKGNKAIAVGEYEVVAITIRFIKDIDVVCIDCWKKLMISLIETADSADINNQQPEAIDKMSNEQLTTNNQKLTTKEPENKRTHELITDEMLEFYSIPMEKVKSEK